MSDTDRMQPIGKIPSLDYSTGREVREHFQAYRDYDLVHLPALVTDLDGIDQARTVLDTAERDITAYNARQATERGDEAASGKARAALAGKYIGRALTQVGEAHMILAQLLEDGYPHLVGDDWTAIAGWLNRMPSLSELHELRRACAVIEGTAPGTASELQRDTPDSN